MSFREELDQWPRERVESLIDAAGPADVARAIARSERGPTELAALLSPAAVAVIGDSRNTPKLNPLRRGTRESEAENRPTHTPLRPATLNGRDSFVAHPAPRNDGVGNARCDDGEGGGFLEAMAREAQRLTRWHFGRTISLYAPIYVSNVCAADCTYCGYAIFSGNDERRLTLSADELRRECASLAARGFQSVLLLTGEARYATPVDKIAESVAIAREYFSSVSIEVYSLDESDYARLCALGLDGVTIYMETYDRDAYAQVHLRGEKADYDYRLDAIERAGRAGARRLNIGVLLGLSDWRVDAFYTALHARYLQRVCWQSSVAVSFPRLRHVPERFHIPRLVTDHELVQYMLAARLHLPEVALVLSTREPADLRDRLLRLGITHMSAGSSTRPGGYATHGDEVLEQFELEDFRGPEEVEAAIRRAGYDPVWKDFDRAFDAVGGTGL